MQVEKDYFTIKPTTKNRRLSNAGLTGIFKCGPQGGMMRSHRTSSLVIISDHAKSIYEDCWASSEVIHYTGMGLVGDVMVVIPGKRSG